MGFSRILIVYEMVNFLHITCSSQLILDDIFKSICWLHSPNIYSSHTEMLPRTCLPPNDVPCPEGLALASNLYMLS